MKENPDLILMDIILEDKVKGIDIARRIRKLEYIPIVYLSAHSEDSVIKRAKITVPCGYLLKIVWHDNVPGSYEIFYRKGIQ